MPQLSSPSATQVQNPSDSMSEFNVLVSIVWGILSRVHTGTLVRVQAVTNDGGVSPVGFVDLLPLVNQVDRARNAVPHITVYRCPYFRLQGGANAVILDPQVGDVGWAGFADRDISSVVANRAQANPGSLRQFDMADAFYFGGWSGTLPSQFVRFSAAGIEIKSPTQVKLSAPDVQIEAATLVVNATTSVAITTPNFTVNGASQFNGAATSSTSFTAPTLAAGTSLTVATKEMGGHTHGGVQTGGGTSGPPT